MKELFFILFIYSSLLSSKIYCQDIIDKNPTSVKGTVVYTTILNGDTVPYVTLKEIKILAERVFSNPEEAEKYRRLKRDVKRAYPYAKLASDKLKEYEVTLAGLKNDRHRNAYMKKVEDELKKEFEGELRKLTVRQGRILIKLIDRETGSSSYYLVKELRGVFSAFMWQSFARLFGSNLKTKYDPNGDDAMIEEIVLFIEKGEI